MRKLLCIAVVSGYRTKITVVINYRETIITVYYRGGWLPYKVFRGCQLPSTNYCAIPWWLFTAANVTEIKNRYRGKPLFLIDTLLVGVGNPKKLPKLCGVAKPACGLLLIKEKRHSDFSLTNKKRKSASATFSFKAVVKFDHPRIPAFQPFMKPVSYFLRKQFHAVQCLYQLRAAILPQTPLLAARADKAGRVIAQIDRAVPLKVRVC